MCTGANVRTLNGAAVAVAVAAFPRDLCGNVVMGGWRELSGVVVI